ncbi:MAG: hydrogenase maturation nickel metallochaperone HypA [Holophagales bacterium]|nr:hydrogenase maturation nickel metallochaperone HypA [Holophagales bacterium]
MHEMSIAVALVEAACEKAADLDARVDAICVRLGPLSGVVRDALEFSFEVAVAGTPIEGARLEIEEMPVLVRCPVCGGEPKPAELQRLCCPDCGTPTPDVVGGRELELYALEVTDDATENR